MLQSEYQEPFHTNVFPHMLFVFAVFLETFIWMRASECFALPSACQLCVGARAIVLLAYVRLPCACSFFFGGSEVAASSHYRKL